MPRQHEYPWSTKGIHAIQAFDWSILMQYNLSNYVTQFKLCSTKFPGANQIAVFVRSLNIITENLKCLFLSYLEGYNLDLKVYLGVFGALVSEYWVLIQIVRRHHCKNAIFDRKNELFSILFQCFGLYLGFISIKLP